MAIEVTTTAFLNEVKEMDFGYVVKFSHPHRYKPKDGDWTTASTTYIDFVLQKAKAAEFADLLQAPEGTRVQFTGFGKPTSFQKKDGSLGSTLKVDITVYEILDAKGTTSLNQLIEDAPF